ncbi:MAG: regulatory protein RecX [Vicinamibacterales bacterium]
MASAFQIALMLLSGRELSEHQLRERLARRKCESDDIDDAISRLRNDGTLDDRRLALAVARRESGVRHRGRLRVLQKIRELGVADSIASASVDEAFGELDEPALLDRALERRLRGRSVDGLDEKARARLVRGLMAQGFHTGDILKRLRS